MPPGGWAPAHFIRESDARPVHRRTAGAGSWAQVNPDHQAGSLLRSRDKAEASSQSGNIRSQMSKDRLEAFSDGMIAIIITIMVLELRPPSEATWTALLPLIPVFLSNVLSLVFLGIYWNNHHHLLQAVEGVAGWVLWANMYLLFWLSMVPFVTAWMGENRFAAQPVALYVAVMLWPNYLLARALLTLHGQESRLATALGSDVKGKASLLLYLVAIPLAFVAAWMACGRYVLVALIWFLPDRRIERILVR
jgi:uncharacterized membrane protein